MSDNLRAGRPNPTTFYEATTDVRRAWAIAAKPFIRSLDRIADAIARRL